MAIKTIKIHPAIGIARLGNSSEHFIGPEKPGDHSPPPGGYKDADCNLKKQAARFRLFGYDENDVLVQEITAADATIQWTAHLGNTKAAGDLFVGPFDPNQSPGPRNASVADRSQLIIDPGPRTISGPGASASFDTGHFMNVRVPLGEMRTDTSGRLLILGGSGAAASPTNTPIWPGVSPNAFANHDGWYDDVSDGPVTASVTLNGMTTPIDAAPAWVICGPPKYAPSIEDIVTLYDVLYQVAVDAGWLSPPATPSFTKDIFPILDRALKVTWLFDFSGHGSLASVIPPSGTPGARQAIAARLRDPAISPTVPSTGGADMPKIWSDAFDTTNTFKTNAALTKTQYAAIQKWAAGTFIDDWTGPPSPATQITPEGLDQAALENCVGAAFFPGIETSWKTRDEYAYVEPFRLDASQRQPGDLTRQMAVPWQADFLDCADGDFATNGELLLWWPAHRPDQVFPEDGSAQTQWNRVLATNVEQLIQNFHRLGIVVQRGAQFLETEREVVCRKCQFLVERSTLGQDEIDARRGQPGGAIVKDAFRVVVDGFSAGDLGLNSSASTLTVPSPIAGMSVQCTGNVAETGSYGGGSQRFTFKYDLDFGPDAAAFAFGTDTKLVPLDVTVQTVSASAEIELIKQPNPFILHGDPSWLSIDLRVFSIKEGDTKFGQMMGTDAPGFIQNVILALTGGNGSAGGQSFDQDLPTDQAGSTLYVYPTEFPNGAGRNVYNFAVAKVHYIGLIGATNVRVFFRLFSAQTTSAAFDSATSYRRATGNPSGQPIPLAGIVDVDYVTIPCFATGRIDTSANAMGQQTDDPNVQTFVAIGGPEVDRFYGCWLDTNQPQTPVLPVVVPPTNPDGPFTLPAPFQPVSVQQAILRNPHQCLVAEIAFDAVEIPLGKDPSNWDKLAQRNLAWADVPNPGRDGSRRALDTFEIRPTPPGFPRAEPPDELMIDWGNVPDGESAQIYLPAVKSTDVLSMADQMYAQHRLTHVDDHTVQCRTGGITYVPVPPGGPGNYAGLLSIDLPATVRKGQSFSVIVRQVTNTFGRQRVKPRRPVNEPMLAVRNVQELAIWRRVLGAFQLDIPVKTKDVLLLPEERLLSVLGWIFQSIPPHNRWYPVFHRYLAQIGDRVRGLGGDPGRVPASPTGDPGPRPHDGRKEPDRDREEATGKIVDLIFDRFGDFEGFLLETEHGECRFFTREKLMAQLAERAWRDRLRLTVWFERDHRHRPVTIVVHRPPAALQL